MQNRELYALKLSEEESGQVKNWYCCAWLVYISAAGVKLLLSVHQTKDELLF